jgi:hypothetical protein
MRARNAERIADCDVAPLETIDAQQGANPKLGGYDGNQQNHHLVLVKCRHVAIEANLVGNKPCQGKQDRIDEALCHLIKEKHYIFSLGFVLTLSGW